MTLPPTPPESPDEPQGEPKTPPQGTPISGAPASPPYYPPPGTPASAPPHYGGPVSGGPVYPPPYPYPAPGSHYPPQGGPVYGGPPQYAAPGRPPPYSPSPVARKRSKRGLFIVLGLVVLLVVCGGGIALIASSGDDNDGKDGAAAPAAEETPGIGDEARDGKFSFIVTKIEPGTTRVGDEFFNESAQGEFVIVDLSVKNIGDVPQIFTDDDQKLFTADGSEYSPDTAADLWLNEDGAAFLEEINPGNQIDVQLAFDVPKGTEPTSIELHDSLFSNGVTVTLK